MRFLALATGCRGPCDIGFEPYPLCSAPNKCLQDACGTALLRSPSFSPREAFARDEFTRVLPLLFANASPTLCGASRSQRVSPDVPLCESRLSYTLLDGLARASGLSIRVVYVNSAQRTVRVLGLGWVGAPAWRPSAYVCVHTGHSHAYAIDPAVGAELCACARSSWPVECTVGALKRKGPTSSGKEGDAAPCHSDGASGSAFAASAPTRFGHLLRLSATDLKAIAEGMPVSDLKDALREFHVPLGSFCEKNELATALRGVVRSQKAARAFTPATREWEEVPAGVLCAAGMEYEFDFKTGKTYARLPEPAGAAASPLPRPPVDRSPVPEKVATSVDNVPVTPPSDCTRKVSEAGSSMSYARTAPSGPLSPSTPANPRYSRTPRETTADRLLRAQGLPRAP